MPKGVAMDKHGKLFQTGDTVIGPYGSAKVVQIPKPTDSAFREVWLWNRKKGNHKVWTMKIVKG